MNNLKRLYIEKVKIYILGNGEFRGEILEYYHSYYVMVEIKQKKFYFRASLTKDGFSIGIRKEFQEYKEYERSFYSITSEGDYSNPLSMTALKDLGKFKEVEMGFYNLTNGHKTIEVVIFGEKLPNASEERKIANDWGYLVEEVLI